MRPGLKVPAQRLLRQTEVAGTFSPGWIHQPGVKVDFYSRLEPPTGSKGLLLGRGYAGGWKVTFSLGWSHQPGLKVPSLYPGRLLSPRARAQHILKLTALVFLLPPSIVPPSILRFLRRFLRFLHRFFSCKGYQSHTLIFYHCLISFCSLYIYSSLLWFFSFVSNLSSKSLQACIFT